MRLGSVVWAANGMVKLRHKHSVRSGFFMKNPSLARFINVSAKIITNISEKSV
jgi:hypothetical protein